MKKKSLYKIFINNVHIISNNITRYHYIIMLINIYIDIIDMALPIAIISDIIDVDIEDWINSIENNNNTNIIKIENKSYEINNENKKSINIEKENNSNTIIKLMKKERCIKNNKNNATNIINVKKVI